MFVLVRASSLKSEELKLKSYKDKIDEVVKKIKKLPEIKDTELDSESEKLSAFVDTERELASGVLKTFQDKKSLTKHQLYVIGMCYFYNNDFDTCVEFLRDSAENKCVIAQYKLGFMYRYGLGVNENIQEAIKWLDMACFNKYHPAYLEIHDILQKIVIINPDGEDPTTIKILEKAEKDGTLKTFKLLET